MGTKIEWTDESWNPIVGCSRVSEGCRHCYAERLAGTRLRHVTAYHGVTRPGPDGEPLWTGRLNFVPAALDKPDRWRKPRRIFVCDMGDIAHNAVPLQWFRDVMAVIVRNGRHTFQMLTKRPEHLEFLIKNTVAHVVPNLWVGTSIEDQATANDRIPRLLRIPAAVRFLSVEPLLGPVNLEGMIGNKVGYEFRPGVDVVPGSLTVSPGIHWVIVGGESGPGARPMSIEWVQSIRDECVKAGVAFFFKQWGEWCPLTVAAVVAEQKRDGRLPAHIPIDPGTGSVRIGKRNAGRILGGRTWDEFPNERRADVDNGQHP